MSGIVNKIKEALHSDHSSSNTTGTHSSTTGTHGTTGVGSSTTHGTHGTHGTTTAGPHDSNLANKADPRVDSDLDGSNRHTTGTHTTGTHATGTHGTSGLGSSNYGSTNAGPHDSNLANKADPRVDSDRDGSNRHTGHSNVTGTTGHSTASGVTSGRQPDHHNTTAGPHSSNLANKADPRVDSDRDGSGLHGTGTNTNNTGYYNIPHHGTTTAGPHDSNIANKADPRVDSDRDGSNLHGATGHSSGLTGTHGTHSNNHGVTGSNTNTYGSSNTGSTTTPHNSNLLNKLDPRVDSNTTTTGSNTHGTTTHGSSGLTGNNTSNTYGSSHTSGPHQTDTANKLDPRVDSDRSNTNAGYGQTGTHAGNFSSSTHTGNTHGVSHSTNAGPHDSNIANKADPRVDSDLDGKGNRHGANTTGGVFGASGSHATAGSGTAQNTAGPHNSDLLNKLDPRVDSDRDHSKTVGGDKTHA